MGTLAKRMFNCDSICERDHLETNLDFEFCIRCESTLDELPVALFYASLAGSVSEICSLKVQNYEQSVFEKTAFKHLLLVNPTFCQITNDVSGTSPQYTYVFVMFCRIYSARGHRERLQALQLRKCSYWEMVRWLRSLYDEVEVVGGPSPQLLPIVQWIHLTSVRPLYLCIRPCILSVLHFQSSPYTNNVIAMVRHRKRLWVTNLARS